MCRDIGIIFQSSLSSNKKLFNRKGRKGREGIQGLEQINLFARWVRQKNLLTCCLPSEPSRPLR
jgi:hypothetical protein